MQHILTGFCIFSLLLASVLFALGYDGTQIRDFLLGVVAVITVAHRIHRSSREVDLPIDKVDRADRRREKRLSDGLTESVDESEGGKSSESSNPP